MNLLFDIDSTITRETEFMIKNAPNYLKKKFGCHFTIDNSNGYDVSEVFGVKKYLEDNGFRQEEIVTELKRINSGFWNKYFVKYIFYPLKSDVAKTISELRKRGCKIYFASLRGRKTHENESLSQKIIRTKVVPFLTKLQLIMNHVKYDGLILVEGNEEKARIAQKLKAKFVFDDQIEVLKMLDYSTSPICIEAPHNVLLSIDDEKIHRIPFDYKSMVSIVYSTNSLRGENVQTQEKKNVKIKKLKVYQRIYTEAFYRIVRTFGKGYVMKRYNPIILGEENLPKEKGANVFVGNHRNVKDPIITIALLENPTHFVALKRMFNYNENIFGKVGKNLGTVFTTFFVHSIGALPIARPTDENYRMVNLQTFRYIAEYLKEKSAVAIYPEGTLNRHPDKDGNILPLKSNASFKIAEKGKAVVRPVAIVWIPNEAGVRNRVIISFLKPIYTNELRENEISEIWNSAINNAISSMNKMIEEMMKVSELS